MTRETDDGVVLYAERLHLELVDDSLYRSPCAHCGRLFTFTAGRTIGVLFGPGRVVVAVVCPRCAKRRRPPARALACVSGLFGAWMIDMCVRFMLLDAHVGQDGFGYFVPMIVSGLVGAAAIGLALHFWFRCGRDRSP